MSNIIETYMTDSVDSNEGFAVFLQVLYSLEKPAGQILCGTLGFAAKINKKLRLLDMEMKIEQVQQVLVVELDVDSKNSSLAGQALDISLELVTAQYSHKPSSHDKECQLQLLQRDISSPLIAYNASRFGCLARAALPIYDQLIDYLDQNPGVNKRLAYLAREVLVLPYLKLAMSSLACLDVHLI